MMPVNKDTLQCVEESDNYGDISSIMRKRVTMKYGLQVISCLLIVYYPISYSMQKKCIILIKFKVLIKMEKRGEFLMLTVDSHTLFCLFTQQYKSFFKHIFIYQCKTMN